jgi:release factor glutamine methyltransferase
VEEIGARLARAGVPWPRAEAIRLLQAVLLAAPEGWVWEEIREVVEPAVRERERRRSIARIMGHKRFRDITVRLADGVFEPCESSETLIEHALWHCRDKGRRVRILDVGTGCGNLLLAALSEMMHASGVGVDISPAAVDLAKENARELGLAGRASFEVGDAAGACEGTFDLVVGNLPWLPSRLVPTLVPEALLHDPREALDGGRDGYDCFRKLAAQFGRITHPGSVGLFQLSREFIDGGKNVFLTAGHNQVETLKDHFGVAIGIGVSIPAAGVRS